MKEIAHVGLNLCGIQGEVFRLSVKRFDWSSPLFVYRFINSFVAQRMADESFLFESCDVTSILDEIEEAYPNSEDNDKGKYATEEMYWIGYIYRYWCYTLQRNIKQVYKIIKPEELHDLYYAYHTLDPPQAIERILEAKNMPTRWNTTTPFAA